MKKSLLFVCALCTVAALMGCGNTPQAKSNGPETENNVRQTETEVSQKEESIVETESSVIETESSQIQAGNSAAQTDSPTSVFSEEDAKNTALKDAGIDAKDVLAISVKKDYDDGREMYDVNIYTTDKDYDYSLSVSDGTILEKEAELVPKMTEDAGNVKVKLADVKKLVFDKVPGAADENLRLSLEYDDGREVYEGEIIYENTAYEFEIDAANGTIMEWSEQML